MELVEKLAYDLLKSVDEIVTKMVIYNWPKTYYDAKQCVKFDNFCYHYAMGHCMHGQNVCESQEYPRYHNDYFNIAKLYNNGKCSINNKRRAYYLAYYLSDYRGFYRSSTIHTFHNIITNDKDINVLEIKYDEKWAKELDDNVLSTQRAIDQYSHVSYTPSIKPSQQCTKSTSNDISDTMSTASYQSYQSRQSYKSYQTYGSSSQSSISYNSRQ